MGEADNFGLVAPRAYIMVFVFASILGWILEFTYRGGRARKLVNPGFLRGPYLPLYGICASGGIFLIIALNEAGLVFYLRWLIYGVFVTSVELLVGLYFLRFFKLRLWDYGEARIHLLGLVTPLYSLVWTMIAVGFEFVVLNAAGFLSGMAAGAFMRFALPAIVILMLLDAMIAHGALILNENERRLVLARIRGDGT